MGFLMPKPKAPPPPPVPEAPPPPAGPSAAEAQAKREEVAAEERRKRGDSGRASTILTSPLGTKDDESESAKKRLLGQ